MRIIVTGANGFVGRLLVGRLARQGHEIVAIDHLIEADCGIEAIAGSIADPVILARAFAGGCDAVVHLATVPGGAAEADSASARRINIDATIALSEAAAEAGRRPRFILASSIAVFGANLPATVDDDTPLRPLLVYGAHKAMIEQWLATLSRRDALDALSLRLPGIVARPAGPSGMKSAFMSDVFHALRADAPFTSPVAADATMWLMSVDTVVAALVHALTLDLALPADRAVTLPALRLRMDELVTTISRRTGIDPARVRYAPDPDLQAAFGAYPALVTARGDALGFHHDGSVDRLVASALATITSQDSVK
ncbi:NAD-dependent epimerase/dehydratase family protein [Sphingomonas sp. So64.6b]|uniref:NAD-dependent epimerase/dehydratase family protein n=1 Tax=Sphingomonas sp. So64.6b TaxID=2997354 RepID=UPI0016047F3E|nr:NAD-dependent epimerase/dehydratase family protein [Sphingomonas sp. So64.6b]QNA83175.1 NAD-dependent epimerase/dehydratase family protein [Sphingomonas sp. So64.6b]